MKANSGGSFPQYVELISRKHGGFEGLKHVIGEKLQGFQAGGQEAAGGPDGAQVASAALESLERGAMPPPEQRAALEAIIIAELRPAIYVVDSTFLSEHPLWTQLSTDDVIRQRLENAFASIGRIELPGHPRLPYGGTGFVVGKDLVMTNRHVAEIFTSGLGTRSLAFRPKARAGVDFIRELERPAGPVFAVRRVRMIHPYWDMALLEVEGIGTRRVLSLSTTDGRDLEGHDIAVVGYPAFDPRNPADVQQKLFDGEYGVKRLQPGELHGGMETASFQKLVRAVTHDCSTLGGNSGSAVLDLSTGQVLGLHFGGSYREQNFAVPASELARDARVVDAGVEFNPAAKPDKTDWPQWWQQADSEELTVGDSDGGAGAGAGRGAGGVVPGVTNRIEVEIPIVISISLGSARPSAQVGVRVRPGTAGETLEAMREPDHDTSYGDRKGYDPLFLDGDDQSLDSVPVPMPTAADPNVLARTQTGGDVLEYQNFSIRMHEKRRIALVAASNISTAPKHRKPEAGKTYTRKALSGLGENDIEKWFADPRLDDEYQLPDVFFTKDRKAFDKGHIVRRDDVAWGSTYDKLKRANGDSYHVTNCSPQVAGFNQSAKGEVNWGDLENMVLAQAASERLSVFAGPVLNRQDPVFYGVSDGGEQLVCRIPRRFWKVIVARVADGIAAYGFVLEQDLDDVEFEFVPEAEFIPVMYPLEEITEMTGVLFDAVVLEADQYDTVRGVEVVQLGGVRRAKG